MSGYPNELKYFMWEYQVHFRISCQNRAETIFEHFDRGLSPKFFLLGFSVEGPLNFQSLLFEEENLDYLRPSFEKLDHYIKKSEEEDPEKRMFYTGPGMQEKMDLRKKESWITAGLQNCLIDSVLGKQNVLFVAPRVKVNGYYVNMVLMLNKEVFNAHYHLTINRFADRYPIATSLLDAAVNFFLDDSLMALQLPSPGSDLVSRTKSTDEIIRESARNLCFSIASKGKSGQGLHGLYKICNDISIQRYEGKENSGQIFITEKNSKYIEFDMEFGETFLLSDVRKTRKLLQMTGGRRGLISDSYHVLGIGTIKDNYDIKSETVFTIKFKGIHCWEAWHMNYSLLIMRYGQADLLHEVINWKKFMSDCKRLFKDITKPQISNLYKLSIAATSQKNGALIVISNDPTQEALRLNKQCIAVKSSILTEELLMSMTSIDGGLLIGIDGKVYAQGVILDGIVGNNGDSARGSRYNSAITYHDFKGKTIATMIIVVSEDGMVDIIPDLKPQISRSEIQEMISLLKEAFDQNKRANFNQIMEWLEGRKFYLNEIQCDEINIIKNQMANREYEFVQVIYDDFVPNQDLDDSYFL